MKLKYLAGATVLCLLVSTTASAQLIAGSPEDAAYSEIEAAGSDAERLRLAQEFEQEFPDSPVHAQLLTMIMTIYNQMQDSENAIAYAEKILALDEDNVEALIALTYNLALTRQNVDGAIEYGERAVAAISSMRSAEPAPGYTEDTWNQYADTLEASARSYLNYAQTIR